jgi:hypothetical protein
MATFVLTERLNNDVADFISAHVHKMRSVDVHVQLLQYPSVLERAIRKSASNTTSHDVIGILKDQHTVHTLHCDENIDFDSRAYMVVLDEWHFIVGQHSYDDVLGDTSNTIAEFFVEKQKDNYIIKFERFDYQFMISSRTPSDHYQCVQDWFCDTVNANANAITTDLVPALVFHELSQVFKEVRTFVGMTRDQMFVDMRYCSDKTWCDIGAVREFFFFRQK